MLLGVHWFSSTEKATLGLNCLLPAHHKEDEAVTFIEHFFQFQYRRNPELFPLTDSLREV